MRYLLDTHIVSYFLRDASASLSQRILDSRPQDLAISTISAGELRFGLSKLAPSKRANSLSLRMNHLFNSLSIEPLPVEAALHYGEIRQQLEALGQPIGGNDLWIAAHALAQDFTLVSNNTGEFQKVAKLHLENWLI
jgi:tRNA(fMet)-specific endonuclease VapC